MKTIFFLMTLVIANISQAVVVQINTAESVVYFHPTPILELNLLDLGKDGGSLTVSTEYSSEVYQQEFEQLKREYPKFEIKTLNANVASSVFLLNLPSIGVSQEIRVRQGQMGPYINESIELNRQQVTKLKNSVDTIKNAALVLKARASFNSMVVVEKYEAGANYCSGFKVNSVKEMIQALGKLEKPTGIKYQQTFTDMKTSALENCFDIGSFNIHSFSHLLQIRVLVVPYGVVQGSFSEKRSQEFNFDINPVINIIIK